MLGCRMRSLIMVLSVIPDEGWAGISETASEADWETCLLRRFVRNSGVIRKEKYWCFGALHYTHITTHANLNHGEDGSKLRASLPAERTLPGRPQKETRRKLPEPVTGSESALGSAEIFCWRVRSACSERGVLVERSRRWPGLIRLGPLGSSSSQ